MADSPRRQYDTPMIEALSHDRSHRKPHTLLSWADVLLGMVSLLMGIGLLTPIVLPAARAWDPLGFGLLGAMVLLPFGFLAIATGQAMRSGDRGCWILQALTTALLGFAAFVVLLSS
jgi:hypothetical protein